MQLLGEDIGARDPAMVATAMPVGGGAGPKTAGTAADAEGNEFGKLFVGGLSQVTNEGSLRAYFGQFGQVEDAVVMMDNQTGRSRGFGFIKFKDATRVSTVLEPASGHVIDGKAVDVKQSNINVKGKTSRNLKIFVGGIAPEHDVEMVREFFGQYGKVTDVNLMLDQSKQRHRGFAFVAFDDERTVQHLVQLHFVDIGGRVVEIKAMKPPNFEARAVAAAAAAAAAVLNHSSAEPIYRADFAAADAAAAAAAAAYPAMPSQLPTAALWPHTSFPCEPSTTGFGWAGGTLAWPGYYSQAGGGTGHIGLIETWPMQPMPPPPPPPPPPPTASAWAPAGWLPQAVVAWPPQQPQLHSGWPGMMQHQHQPQPQLMPPPPPPVIQPLGCWEQNLHQLTSAAIAPPPSWPHHSLQQPLPPLPPPPPPYQPVPPDAAIVAVDAADDAPPGDQHQQAPGSPLLLSRHRRRQTVTRVDRGPDPAGFWLYPKDPQVAAPLSAGSAAASSLSHVAAGDFDRCDASDVAASYGRDL